ncbi:hypothetical protein WR25_13032 [Diploscapter pachys]|uniref:ShKT domain-containing protein n=1 Tax=Diploscapter pachys TaxID=2018661 RepID=A0A2A2JUP1_9BILA|nr:hypothetical protein WR25_13032 [Diploscapter pachys]
MHSLLLLLAAPVSVRAGMTITTWGSDITSSECDQHQGCDPGGWLYCSAPMRKCPCDEKPAYQTASNSQYRAYCNSYDIDGRVLTADDRNKCFNCNLPVCDGPYNPACHPTCGRKICVNGIPTQEMDSCPSNHPKNVAKCCMWGGSYCSCVTGEWLDVNQKTMDALGCNGNCQNANVTYDDECNAAPPPSGCTGSNCNTDVRPPTSLEYSCSQQAGWNKCGESWMQGYCCMSCKRCAGSGGSNSTNPPPTSAPPSGCTDVPPDGSYTCQQQAGFGKCNESWMQGHCDLSCGRCGYDYFLDNNNFFKGMPVPTSHQTLIFPVISKFLGGNAEKAGCRATATTLAGDANVYKIKMMKNSLIYMLNHFMENLNSIASSDFWIACDSLLKTGYCSRTAEVERCRKMVLLNFLRSYSNFTSPTTVPWAQNQDNVGRPLSLSLVFAVMNPSVMTKKFFEDSVKTVSSDPRVVKILGLSLSTQNRLESDIAAPDTSIEMEE